MPPGSAQGREGSYDHSARRRHIVISQLDEERAIWKAKQRLTEDEGRATRIVHAMSTGFIGGGRSVGWKKPKPVTWSWMREQIRKAHDRRRIVVIVRCELHSRERERKQRKERNLVAKAVKGLTEWCWIQVREREGEPSEGEANDEERYSAEWVYETYLQALEEKISSSTIHSYWYHGMQEVLRSHLGTQDLHISLGAVVAVQNRGDDPKASQPIARVGPESLATCCDPTDEQLVDVTREVHELERRTALRDRRLEPFLACPVEVEERKTQRRQPVLPLKGDQVFPIHDARTEPMVCRVCGCTELNCSACIEATGYPCTWFIASEPHPGMPICSRCVSEAVEAKNEPECQPDGTCQIEMSGPWGMIEATMAPGGGESRVTACMNSAHIDRFVAEVMRDHGPFQAGGPE